MRCVLANALFLCFLSEFYAGDIHRPPDGTPLPRTPQDEWEDLLQWFKRWKANETLSDWKANAFSQNMEEEDAILEDEAFEGSGESMSREEELEEENIIRGVSLAFVFDSTGSMNDELNQVKAGASKILAALRDHPDAPIYNYIWVPFSDPGIGPVTVTRDDKVFQERVHDVVVFGGGDCPEMSIGAIKKALEASLPNSYVYVFTDASAKDHRLANEVVSLVQRKQSQVVFILTGDCMDLDEPNYKAYERIAESSSGQIYRLSRNEVKEVLEYVNVAIQPHVVSLLSLSKPAPDKTNPDRLEVVIDESLKQFTVSVSGVNASINVTDPKGVNVLGPPKLENVLNLSNIKIVNVKEPDPGSWSVFINSDSNYTVRSTGLSKVNFNHGFSTAETLNLKETNYRPLKGAKSFILIQTSDAEKVFNITSVDFVSLSGDVLQHLQLAPVPGMSGLYKGGSFVPPSEFFYLGVTGFGRDGLPVKRITSTAVSAQLPEKPIITMRSSAAGRVNGFESLKCHVESVIPFNVRWYKNGSFIGEEKNCSETCEVILTIEKLTLQSEGTYSCSARSVAGFDSKSLALTVIGDPPSVVVKSPVVISSGETAYLTCSVESNMPYVVKWTQFTARNQRSGVLHPVSTGVKLANNTLMIESARAEDEGWYVCKATNKGGESQGRVLLIVKEPLVVKVEPTSISYVEGGSARFSCFASGKPQPRLEWVRDQRPIKNEEPSVFVEEVNGKLNLVIDYLEKKDGGVYFCNAVNDEGSAMAMAELVYTEKPRVKANENSVMMKAGSEVVLRCSGSGEPEPHIRWYKGEVEVGGDSRFKVDTGTLKIHSLHASDAGEYSCVAQNALGSDIDYIGLIVGSSPTFLQKPAGEKKIQIGHNGTVACSAIGVPSPEVKWRRSDDKPLDSERMFILSSGALRITRTKVDDGGQYVCTAENVFGSASNQVSITVTGIEKPVADKTVELRNVEISSGSDLNIPCGIILGNPPGQVKWFKNGKEVVEDEHRVVEGSGKLVIRNATAVDRGSYLCLVQNSAGNSSRPYEVVITESPKIKERSDVGMKAKVGGEIVIPCPVEGFPVPTVTWTRNGLPLPTSSTIFQDEAGSLIIRNLTEDGTGVYVCTAINSVGSASKATSIHVLVPPVFPIDVQDLPVNVVEGHVVVLDCNVTAVPEPTISWFKNDEPLLQNSDQPKILRFVANMDDTGVFKCVADNEAGSSFKEFNVSILVPPKILGRNSEESIKAKAGVPITLHCDVFGVPEPNILWQRNGMYLTQNTSEVSISGSGSLTIHNVTKESAGAYTCDAENLGGITQRIFYLQVNFPPRIIEEGNTSRVTTLREGDDYSLACLVEGSPKPNVVWRKNGLPILEQHPDLLVLEDNTLVFLHVSRETTGLYKCEAVSSEGVASTEHEVKVLIPPSLTSEFYPTRLDVNEGDSLALTCPMSLSEPPSHIQWFKDGEPLVFLQERSDEAQMKLSLDQRTLTIIEAHPSDGGNYSCAATNPAGRSDAKFLVDVLMTPHFEEFSHVAYRTILTGGEVVLNCSVSGNPQPKVRWRKESTPVTPHNTPGVHVSQDKQHLVIVNGRVHHTGTYVCVATNKVSTKEREFYVTVLEPPQIAGPLKEVVDVMQGDNVTLRCEGIGVPAPTFTWTKQDAAKKLLTSGQNYLNIPNAGCDDSGTYLCEVTNTAGTRTKHFEVNVFQKPHIDNHDHVDQLTGVVGGNVTLACKATGVPTPEITWLHNGHILSPKRSARRQRVADYDWQFSEDGHVSLTISDLRQRHKGTYTLLASNVAGMGQKQFNVRILVPPTLPDGRPETQSVKVVHPFPVVLKCPANGDPQPSIDWFRGDVDGERVVENEEVVLEEDELRIREPRTEHSGVYTCVAENDVGKIARHFNVTVVEPPAIEGGHMETLTFLTNDTLVLHCNSTGAEGFKHEWFHSSRLLKNSSDSVFIDSGRTLMVPKLRPKHAGVYTCLVTNVAGSAEISYSVDVHVPPAPSGESSVHKVVHLHRPFSLHCSFTGHPPPEITWKKDGDLFVADSSESVLSDNSYLVFPHSKAGDGGEYKCVARNSAGAGEMSFRVEVVVPGEWTHWSSWSECSVSCGLGEQGRRRNCGTEQGDANLGIRVDESRCRGSDSDRRKCFKECQIDGGWTSWGSWTGCSKTCGSGVRRRWRTCESPKGEGGGKECSGEDSEEEACKEKECPVNGEWSGWSEWSECSDTCGGGVMQRVRRCDSPPPLQGGNDCPGWGSELKTCNKHKCQDHRGWSPWSPWGPCSETCGLGQQRRSRLCLPFSPKEGCEGENVEVRRCIVRGCHVAAVPTAANLHLRGVLNGSPVDNRFDASIQNIDSERIVSANVQEVSRNSEWLPYTPFILFPLCWNAAYETDNADNGFSLTEGNFMSQSDIKFDTGEELKVKHKGGGMDDNGALTVEIEVIGEVPLPRPYAQVLVRPPSQDLIQTGTNTLYSSTAGNVTVGERDVGYLWNSSVSYDDAAGTMPYLVEKLSVRQVGEGNDWMEEIGRFVASSAIGRKYKDDRCPSGFVHDPKHLHCKDINECDSTEDLCQTGMICRNTFGSYDCVCAPGFRPTENGCADVDECAQNLHSCSHFCHNNLGSYRCSCPFGLRLEPDLLTCSGHDHCRRPNICSRDEICINLSGASRCLGAPCPTGYQRTHPNRNCVRSCNRGQECPSGASVSESIVFVTTTWKLSDPNLFVHLDPPEEPRGNIAKTDYRMTEAEDTFDIRVSRGRGSLYPTQRLRRDRLYRAKAEASSYSVSGRLVHVTEFVIFVAVA